MARRGYAAVRRRSVPGASRFARPHRSAGLRPEWLRSEPVLLGETCRYEHQRERRTEKPDPRRYRSEGDPSGTSANTAVVRVAGRASQVVLDWHRRRWNGLFVLQCNGVTALLRRTCRSEVATPLFSAIRDAKEAARLRERPSAFAPASASPAPAARAPAPSLAHVCAAARAAERVRSREESMLEMSISVL